MLITFYIESESLYLPHCVICHSSGLWFWEINVRNWAEDLQITPFVWLNLFIYVWLKDCEWGHFKSQPEIYEFLIWNLARNDILPIGGFGGTISGNFSHCQKVQAESKIVQYGILAFHKYKFASWIVSFACQIHRENARQDWDNSMLWSQLLSTCFNIFISMRYGNIWVEMNIHKI